VFNVYYHSSGDMKELEDESVGIVVTSPPYFQMRGDHSTDSYSEYLKDMDKIVKETWRVMKYGRIMAVVISNYLLDSKMYPVAFDYYNLCINGGFAFVEDIIWTKYANNCQKRGGVILQHPHPGYYYPNPQHEHIFIFSKGEYSRKRCGDEIIPNSILRGNLNDVWLINTIAVTGRVKDSKGNSHSSEYPIEIPRRLIWLYSCKDDLVLDTFLGSGTTIKAAEEIGRDSVGYEKLTVNEKGVNYKEIINKKIQKGQLRINDFQNL